MKKSTLLLIVFQSFFSLCYSQTWREYAEYTSVQIGPEVNDRVFSDNSLAKHYGGGLFFRVHDDDVNSDYRDVMLLTEDANVGIGMVPSAKLSVNGEISWGTSGARLSTNQGASIELRGSGVPYIDFSNDQTSDYDIRLIAVDDDKLNIAGGNVGIGTSNPTAKLEVAGNLKVNSGAHSNIRLGQQNNDAIIVDNSDNSFYGGGMFFRVHDDSMTHAYRDVMMLAESGQVGIGTRTMGTHKLAVAGSIGARQIKVEATGWSDFVFEEDYNLPSLKEVEQHIAEKGHLQDIPSAENIIANGFDLGEMDAKLLQKIEELTLYTIEQEKQITAQQEKNEQLEARLAKLEALLLKINN